MIIYETEEEIPVSSTSLNHAAFIRSDSFDGMMPEEVEFNVDISGESSSADTSRNSTMDDPNSKCDVTADKSVNQDVVPVDVVKEEAPVSKSIPEDNSGEGDNDPTEGDNGPTEGDNGPTEGDNGPTEGDTGPTEGDTGPTEGDGSCSSALRHQLSCHLLRFHFRLSSTRLVYLKMEDTNLQLAKLLATKRVDLIIIH